MKKTLIAMMLIASTSAFAGEPTKCGGKVYDPALYECTGNKLVDASETVWDSAGRAIDDAGDAISDGASAVYKAIKFW